MPTSPSIPAAQPSSRLASARRLASTLLLGFASGLPLALTSTAMQAWLSIEGLDMAAIGFLSLVGLPYTFKFLWAPLMDRFDLPLAGRRRGWLVVTQLALAAALWWLAGTSPTGATQAFAAIALLVAFLSASQDVVVDAYRTELLPADERGLGSSLTVMGYRLAIVLSGGVVLIWVDPVQGGGWQWPQVYRAMAGLMLAAVVVSVAVLPRLAPARPPASAPRRDLLGFVAVIAAVAAGVLLTRQVLTPLVAALFAGWMKTTSLPPSLQARWLDLAALLFGVAVTLPLAGWAARAARFETMLGGLRSYFVQPRAGAMLALVVLYKLCDAFALALMTPFLLKGVGYGPAEVGLVFKVIGTWLTIGGALFGGALMLRLNLWRSLMVFGVLQMASNAGFWWLAVHGKSAEPGIVVPAFDWGVVQLRHATAIDPRLLWAVAAENLASGMSTSAFAALLMALCRRQFAATHYALLSAFASVGRVWVGPLAGVTAESVGWPAFFVIAAVAAVPGLVLLGRLREAMRPLEFGPRAGTVAAPAD